MNSPSQGKKVAPGGRAGDPVAKVPPYRAPLRKESHPQHLRQVVVNLGDLGRLRSGSPLQNFSGEARQIFEAMLDDFLQALVR